MNAIIGRDICVKRYTNLYESANGCRLCLFLLAILAVAVHANEKSELSSAVYVNKNVVIADSVFTWLPDDAMRASWGSRGVENGKWGFVSESTPYCPVSQVSGSVYDVFDGDNASGFVWKTVSLNEKCPVDSINCIEEDGESIVAR